MNFKALSCLKLFVLLPFFAVAEKPPTKMSHIETKVTERISDKSLQRLKIQESLKLNSLSDRAETIEKISKFSRKLKIDVENASKAEKNGGVDTGGGTVIRTAQGIGLLDLYLNAPEIFLDRVSGQKNLKESRSLRTLGVDLVKNSEDVLVQKAKAQIFKWQQSSPIVTSELLYSLETLPFYYHKNKIISLPVKYYIPLESDVSPDQLKMVALYVHGFGVHLDFDSVKNIPEKHQIALLIHESLRHVKFVGKFTFSDQTLQKLTAQLMKDPLGNDSLDTAENIQGPKLIDIFERIVFFERADLAFENFCHYFNSHRNDLIIVPDHRHFQCSFDSRLLNFKELSDKIDSVFSILYVQREWDDELRGLMWDFSLLKTKALNIRLTDTLIPASFYGSYLRARSERLSFDSTIDAANESFWGVSKSTADVFKLKMNYYLKEAELKLQSKE